MRLSSRAWSFVTVAVIFVADFVTKRVVLAHADMLRTEGVTVIEGLLRWTYVRNPGAAFGMLPGQRWIFVTVSSLAVVGLTWLLLRRTTAGLKRAAYTLILAGAAGNLVDRIFYGGYVVDFVEMGWRGSTFPVYNIADMGVSIGAALLVLALLRERDERPATPAATEPDEDGVERVAGRDPASGDTRGHG